jgi:hypothetical protein
MKRFIFLVSLVVLVFAVSFWAQTTAPKPDPELKKLSALVGHWTYEGEYKAGPTGPGGNAKGDELIQWINGGFFLQDLEIEKVALGETRFALIYAYDPVSKNIVCSGLGIDGSKVTGIVKVSGNTSTLEGKYLVAGKENFAKITLVVAADLMSIAQKAEISEDGKTWAPFFEGKWTKVKPAPKTK